VCWIEDSQVYGCDLEGFDMWDVLVMVSLVALNGGLQK
jgi:hypothetical protein